MWQWNNAAHPNYLGHHDPAIESESKAADLIKFDSEDEYPNRLDYYRRIKEAAAGTTSAPASRP